MNPLEDLSKKSGVPLSSINDGSLNTATLSSMVQQPTTPPTPSQINRSITQPTTSPAEQYLGNFQAPESVTEIANRKRKESQGLIDSVKELYASEFQSIEARRAERLSEQNAGSVLSGTAGSGRAFAARDGVNVASDKERQQLVAKKTAELQGIYSKISSEASTEALTQKANATTQAEGIIKRDGEKQTKAVENIKLLAQSGSVDFDAFATNPNNSQVFQYALQSVGGSEQALRGMFAANRPKDQIVGTPTRVGDHFIQAYENPLTGKISYDKVSLPEGVTLPKEYKTFEKMGDNLVAIPENWDGDTSKLVTIAGQPSSEDMLRQQMLKLQITGQSLENSKKRQELNSDSGGGSGSSDPIVSSWVQAIQNGSAAISSVPDKLKNAVVSALGSSSTTNDTKSQQQLEVLNLARELKKDDAVGKKSAIGASFAKLVPYGQQAGLQGNRTAFEAKVQSLKSHLTLDNLKLLKGPMSDKDLAFLQSVGSSLDTNMSEKGFNDEMDKVIKKFEQTTGTAGTTSGKIRVKLSNGQTGTIDAADFDSNSMTKL